MRSSCGDVRWNFSCVFPVQMTDRLIAEEELYFGYDVDIISAPGAKRRIHEPCHAYRPVVWNHFEVSCFFFFFCFLFAFINVLLGRGNFVRPQLVRLWDVLSAGGSACFCWNALDAMLLCLFGCIMCVSQEVARLYVPPFAFSKFCD